jgi:hypothetical protein
MARTCSGVVRMMGDTLLATVNRHYFNLDDETLQTIVEGWQAPEVEVTKRVHVSRLRL